MITRFYKTTRYIGVKYHVKDTMGEWREEINLQSFYGKPYNRFEFDEIHEYTPELWQLFVNKATEQGKATNREVVQADNWLYLVPIWTHGVRLSEVKASQVTNPVNIPEKLLQDLWLNDRWSNKGTREERDFSWQEYLEIRNKIRSELNIDDEEIDRQLTAYKRANRGYIASLKRKGYINLNPKSRTAWRYYGVSELPNPRPPANWWSKTYPGVAANYPGASKAQLGQITAGIWYNFSPATRKRLIAKYD